MTSPGREDRPRDDRPRDDRIDVGRPRRPDEGRMKEVAERAGVAMSSVSRVLSGHRDVSVSMRERVMSAVEELGYEPNRLAGMLRRGATQTVGFVVGDISNPLLAQIVLGAETTLNAAGYAMLLTNSIYDGTLDAEHVRLLQQRRVDGMLLSISDESNAETLTALVRASAPWVLVDRSLDGHPDAGGDPADADEPGTEPAELGSRVLSDHRTGMTQAIDHLVSLGHRRIALIAGAPYVRPTRERIAALEDAAERGSGLLPQVRAGSYTERHGVAATRELLSGRRRPTAIIAGGNQILVGVLRALQEWGLAIPNDMSVITCDAVPLAAFITPALATIRRNPGEIGDAAARLLLHRLAGHPPQTLTLPTEYLPAASCAAPADDLASRRA